MSPCIPCRRQSPVPFMVKYLELNGTVIFSNHLLRNDNAFIQSTIINEDAFYITLVALLHHALQTVPYIRRHIVNRYDDRNLYAFRLHSFLASRPYNISRSCLFSTMQATNASIIHSMARHQPATSRKDADSASPEVLPP